MLDTFDTVTTGDIAKTGALVLDLSASTRDLAIGTGAGADQIRGGSGNDTITTNDGDDLVNGGEGDNVLSSGAGNDTIVGGGGNDILDGGADNDEITTGAGNDLVRAGDGVDAINLYSDFTPSDTVDGGAGTDMIRVTTIAASNAAGLFSNTTSVEELSFTEVSHGTFDAALTKANEAGVNSYSLTGIDGDTALEKVVNNARVFLNVGGSGTHALALTHVANSAADSLSLAIITSSSDRTFSAISAVHDEVMSINVVDLAPDGVEKITLGALVAPELRNLVIGGSGPDRR